MEWTCVKSQEQARTIARGRWAVSELEAFVAINKVLYSLALLPLSLIKLTVPGYKSSSLTSGITGDSELND